MSSNLMEAVRKAYAHDPDRQKRWAWLVGSDDKIAEDLQRYSGSKRRPLQEKLDYVRIGTEILLENTMRQIAEEQLRDRSLLKLSPEKFYEEIDTSAIIPFIRFALPMVRRVVPRTYATSLVGFQPMPMPDGKIFYLNFKYGETKYPTTLGDRIDGTGTNKSYGGARKYEYFVGAGGGSQTVELANYGAKNVKVYVDGVLLTSGVVTNPGAGGGGSATSADPDEVVITPGPTLNSKVLVVYDNVSEGQTARDIDMGMESKTISAEAIKLRSAMTVETMQDFAAYHGLTSEVELTNAMAGEISREIDLNIIERLFLNAAAGNVNWDSGGYLLGDDNTFFRKEYRRTLYEAIIAANNLIYRKRFVNATWIVGGVGAVERLEKLEHFVINEDTDAPDDAFVARRYEGILAGKFKIYKDARLADTQLLMGYTGSTPFHTGAVYAPYIPAYMTDLLPDPNINFKMRKGIMSRYGFEVVVPEVYSTLTIL